MNSSSRPRPERQALEDWSREEVAAWVRTTATQVSVRPRTATWAETRARIVRERRRHAVRRAGLIGAATVAVIAVVAAVLSVGPLDQRNKPAAVVPAGGGGTTPTPTPGQQPAVPTEVPGAAGQPPIKIRLVDTPRAVPLTEGDKATLSQRCGFPGDTPGDTRRVLGAIQDKQGAAALVVAETFMTLCTIPTGADGRLAFDQATAELGQGAKLYEQYLLPPDGPLTSFNFQGGGWLYDRYGAGRVSPDVALLLAVFPTGESIVVPILDDGAFLARFKVEGENFPAWDQPLAFYAFDAAGTLVDQLAAWKDPTDIPEYPSPERSNELREACLQAASRAPNRPADLSDKGYPTGALLPAAPGHDGFILANLDRISINCTGPVDASGFPIPERLTYRASSTARPPG
ncbi:MULTISPECIES: hypothetical protein [Pseudofrankia]|uniref:hypothetical protein n=1 Tax=Pseudofrankia TaxID=2994363 RepID=UPI000234BEE7|nr:MULTISPECIES: hypothetical protein [Pseudofrankia]OHV36022.1 hypothetical protein BCD49_20725 [Pseudofrankia sp. EUN1h]